MIIKEHAIKRLLAVAKIWQAHHNQSVCQIALKLEDELDEFHDARFRSIQELDEIGDILATALRLVVRLEPKELAFVTQVAEHKAAVRLGPDGVKNKAAEHAHAIALARLMGLA